MVAEKSGKVMTCFWVAEEEVISQGAFAKKMKIRQMVSILTHSWGVTVVLCHHKSIAETVTMHSFFSLIMTLQRAE